MRALGWTAMVGAGVMFAACGGASLPTLTTGTEASSGSSSTPGPTPTVTVTVLPQPSISYGFTVSGPVSATPGSLVSYTVQALNSDGSNNSHFQGSVKFLTSDVQATAPAQNTLIGGIGIFTIRYYTGGPQTLTAIDVDNNTSIGTSTPTAVAGPMVSVAEQSACANARDGSILYCWGKNSSYQISLNLTRPSLYGAPQAVSLAGVSAVTGQTGLTGVTGMPSVVSTNSATLPTTYTSVMTAGGVGNENYTCVTTLTGNVWCWGYDDYGQLGDQGVNTGLGSGSYVPSLVEIQQGGAALSGIVQLSGASTHVCAVSSAGHVYCWGENTNGELGNGAQTTAKSMGNGGANVAFGTLNATVLPATEVLGGAQGGTYLSGVVSVVTSQYVTCALTNVGSVYCWGYNTNLQLGNGSTDDSIVATSPVKVVSTSGSGALGQIVGISAMADGMCGTDITGAVFCWGQGNGYGDIGVTTSPTHATPMQVLAINNAFTLTGVIQTSRNWDAAGACALITGGTLDCWGNDAFDQLGFATVASTSGPIQGGILAQQVVAGEQASGGAQTSTALSHVVNASFAGGENGGVGCALTYSSGSNAYSVYCWGADNGTGVLGTDFYMTNENGSATGENWAGHGPGYSWFPMQACSTASSATEVATAAGPDGCSAGFLSF